MILATVLQDSITATGAVLLVAIAGVFLGVYFLPAFLGRRKRNAMAIFAFNLLLGWTFLGWVAALIWALTKDAPTAG
jgi:hypothetical protein